MSESRAVKDNNNVKRVCIIGAGVSGLPSIKACLEEGHMPVCYEKTHDLGGLWNYRHLGKGEATVMRTTVVNTSKEMMSFSDYAAPDHWPNYFHNTYLNKYLHDYAEHFGLNKYIHFGVKQAPDYAETGAYLVKTNQSGEFERFDAVMLCTGHHANPFQGHINGLNKFTGEHLHAQLYYEPEPFKDKRVLVIGIGNSALDISVDLANIASQVYLSTRRGAWVWNRIDYRGLPFDIQWLSSVAFDLKALFGWTVENAFMELVLNLKLDHDMFGVRPNHRFFSQHPTLNDHLASYLASGQIIVKDDISDINGRTVTFTNGSIVEDIDVIISCTGYTFGYAFLEPASLCPVQLNDISLYKTVFPPHLPHPTLAVIGLVQPYGAIQPIAELQARWFAQILSGNLTLPSTVNMQKAVVKYKQDMATRYYRSQRQTVQVDYIDIADNLSQEFGAKPNRLALLFTDPFLAISMYLGPNYPMVYRLQGPHGNYSAARSSLMDARRRTVRPLCTTKRMHDTWQYQSNFAPFSLGAVVVYLWFIGTFVCYWGMSASDSVATSICFAIGWHLVVYAAGRFTEIKYDNYTHIFELFPRFKHSLWPKTVKYDPKHSDTQM